MQKDELISQIEEAFKDVPYPGDENIVDDPNHCPECEEVSEAFKGKHWKEVVSSLHSFPDNIYLLTPEAYQFYLPAFLIYSILKDESDMRVDFTIHSFSFAKFRSQIELFSIEQKKVIKAFLEYMERKFLSEENEFGVNDVYEALKTLKEIL